jgi:LytS/YehU family sensor histidine kinase
MLSYCIDSELIVSNDHEALIGGILGGPFIITTLAAIGGILTYIKKKLQAKVDMQCDSNL